MLYEVITDPNWTSCPVCAAEERTHRGRDQFVGGSASDQRKTSVGSVPPSAGRRETRAMPQQTTSQPGGYFGKGESRKIVGVLITYTWRPEGQLFPVREGKTFVGSGDISSEARPCDVQIDVDEKMSGEHALILCRRGNKDEMNYEIIDQTSSNGTFLNGKMLRSNLSMELSSYDEIQTGSTVWTFIRIKAPEAVAEVVKAPAPVEEPPKPEPPSSGA